MTSASSSLHRLVNKKVFFNPGGRAGMRAATVVGVASNEYPTMPGVYAKCEEPMVELYLPPSMPHGPEVMSAWVKRSLIVVPGDDV